MYTIRSETTSAAILALRARLVTKSRISIDLSLALTRINQYCGMQMQKCNFSIEATAPYNPIQCISLSSVAAASSQINKGRIYHDHTKDTQVEAEASQCSLKWRTPF